LLGLDLSGVDFTNTNLTGANLWGANLTNTNLSNANLKDADLTSANLSGAALAGANIEGTLVSDIQGTPVSMPTGWSVSAGTFTRSISMVGVIISGVAELGQTLTVAPSTVPVDAEFEYQWFRNGIAISGETAAQHLVSLADMAASLTVQVIASRTGYVSAIQLSPALVIPDTFSALNRVQTVGNTNLGSTITLSASGKSAASTLKYQMSRDGGITWINIQGNTYTVTYEDLGLTLKFRAVQSAVGYQTQVTDFGTKSIANSMMMPGFAVGKIDNANSFGSLGVLNTPGTQLRAIKSPWMSNIRVTSFWFSSTVGGLSTKSVYKLQLSDVGSTIRYVEVGVAADGSVTYRISSAIQVRAFGFDNATAPTVSGVSVMGAKMKATIGASWASGTKYTYQWLSNGAPIGGAINQVMVLGLDQIDKTLAVQVCGYKTGYETKCLTSQASMVTKATLTLTSDPKISSTVAKVGSVLRGYPGKWTAGTKLSFQWLKDGAALPGMTDTSYQISLADMGHQISLQVTASKAGYFDLVKVSTEKSLN
ncbi:MAG: pentapeptide repeat-containing protein, partial [Micrococcales bacterium]|nr:pentapeptide repeat-containing protein [Micrococcales bacterium]